MNRDSTLPAIVPRRTSPAQPNWATRINSAWRKSLENVLEAGRLLIEAKQELAHGEFGEMLQSQLDFNPRMAQQLMVIAGHPTLSNAINGSYLPRSWTTLYELAKVPPAELESLIQQGEITPSLERKAALRLIRENAPPTGRTSAAPGEVPEQAFASIVVDPPWAYQNQATRGAAKDHYETMTLAELKELPAFLEKDGFLIAPNAHLYLWATNNFLLEAFDLIDAWAFDYKTLLTWVKPQMGMGNYFRSMTEHVLFGVRGKLGTHKRDITNVINANRTQHSSKPDAFYDLVESQSPGPYLDVFSRRRRFNWMVWGDEA